jgi:predicted metal-dependent hydrolase
MTAYFQFGSKKIQYNLKFTDRKTLGITVTPDLDVLVKAPIGTTIEKIEEKLRKKAPWIIRQQSFFLTFQPKTPARKYVSGETHLYLGRQYHLKVFKGEAKRDVVLLKGKFLEVHTSKKTNIKQLVDAWYLTKAREKFHEIAKPMFEGFTSKHRLSDLPFQLLIRNMPTRWGSCTAKGKIILNPELIKAPKACIAYVVVHELCHLIHHDHTKKFIDLQSKEMPDWEKWKEKLERLLA